MSFIFNYLPESLLWFLFFIKYMIGDDLRKITISTIDVKILDVSFASYIYFIWRCKYSGIRLQEIYEKYPNLGYIYLQYKGTKYILNLHNNFMGQLYNPLTQETYPEGSLMFIEDTIFPT